jgi:predicted ATPase
MARRTLEGPPPLGGGGYLRWIRLDDDTPTHGYPYALPVVAALRSAGQWDLDPAVTFLIGDNGTGKSTLVEAVAVAAGFNPEGGSRSFRFATTAEAESGLGRYLRLVRGVTKPRTGFFLRAESFYNVATEVDRLGELRPYGGRSLHERSHGESFLALAVHRFGPRGLYLLDEPESALSVHGCLALLARMVDLVKEGCQFLVATHSPILLAHPGAAIWQIDAAGALHRVDYDDADPVRMHRDFLADPGRYLHHLLRD